jgi:hypothetical protein
MTLTRTTEIIAPRAVEYLSDEESGLFTYEDLQDIALRSCTRMAPNKLTYYSDTWDFFLQFEDEVEDYFYDKYGDTWLDKFAKHSTSVRGMVNHMVWTFVDSIAKEITGIK